MDAKAAGGLTVPGRRPERARAGYRRLGAGAAALSLPPRPSASGAIIGGEMVTVTKSWRRWSGPRGELVRAAELAANDLRSWTGLESWVTVDLEDRRGVSETAPGVETLTSRHPSEVSQLASVTIFVRPDSDSGGTSGAASRGRTRGAGRRRGRPGTRCGSASARSAPPSGTGTGR